MLLRLPSKCLQNRLKKANHLCNGITMSSPLSTGQANKSIDKKVLVCSTIPDLIPELQKKIPGYDFKQVARTDLQNKQVKSIERWEYMIYLILMNL